MQLRKIFSAVVAVMIFAICFVGEAATDISSNQISVIGYGVAPVNARSATHGKVMARRAAIVDAYRRLGEEVRGVQMDSETSVEQAMIVSDVVNTKVSAFVQGGRIVEEHQKYDKSGRKIYGYKNLDPDKVIRNGMVDYSPHGTSARAGSNPLVINCVGVEHFYNPVISVEDADRILAYNQKNRFLEATNVVFLR